jgi:hypothetical protein
MREACVTRNHRRGTSTLVVGFVVLLGILLAGCGQSASSAGAPLKGAQAGEASDLLYVVTGSGTGASGPSIVALRPQTGTHVLSLPIGLLTLDQQRLYTATSAGGRTTVTVYATRSGAQLGSFTFAGAFGLQGGAVAPGYGSAVLSYDGHWLVLRAVGEGTTTNATTFALVDTETRRLVRTIALNGAFDLDAISPEGHMLFLIQNLGDAQHHYYVRAYDLLAGHLLDGIIVDKTEVNEAQMQGSALTRQVARDGSFAYTLYINTAENKAFIHILPLADSPSQGLFARCVDLPVGTSANLLHFYTLTLAPDGSMLYAANAALGLVSAVNLDQQSIFNDHVALSGHFDPQAGGVAPGDAARVLYGGAALAADRRTLYVAGLHGIWAVRTSDLRVQQTYMTHGAFTSLALASTGQDLFATDPLHGILLIPLTQGGVAQSIPTSIQAPWGIFVLGG